MRTVMVCCLLACACTSTNTVRCGELTCAPGSLCSPDGSRCATVSQLEACAGLPDGTGCSVPGATVGACDRGLCVTAGCGNGVVEADEICDDGNRIARDGCSVDCKSLETCGDGVTDPGVGEHCDCGNDPLKVPFGCNGINSMIPSATCRLDCTPGRCGDGVVDLHEQCDDGNVIPGDGCRADCLGRWTKMPVNTLVALSDVAAASATDAWAVGPRLIMRWDGVTWTKLTLPAMMQNGRGFTHVYVAAKDDVFVISDDPVSATINKVFRYLDGTWTDVPLPADAWFEYIGGRGADIYLSGFDTASSTAHTARVAHWDGSAFVDADSASLPFDGIPHTVTALADGTAITIENVITFSTGGNVYRKAPGGSWTLDTSVNGNVVTAGTNELYVFTYVGTSNVAPNGTTYTQLADSWEIAGAAAASAIDGFAIAVSNQGAAMLCTTSPARCVVSDTGTTSNLKGVHVIDDKHAFIVGYDGTILY